MQALFHLIWLPLKVGIQPFILQSQLYSSVKDRTQVDRDLEVWFLNLQICNIAPDAKLFLNHDLILGLPKMCFIN